ncbi:hypothetical protein Cni_G25550 [Canna indica]|uniref:Uncharacterized protein n=1 Tax=Canna indica TaxID=4628 RepID=A0AAQ3L075_9LILI|nr:hypothetical protein Cni_G25550 [Canna indica]
MGNGLSSCIAPPKGPRRARLLGRRRHRALSRATSHRRAHVSLPRSRRLSRGLLLPQSPRPVLAIGDELLPGRTYFMLPIVMLPCHASLHAMSLETLSPIGPIRASLVNGAGPSSFAYVKGSKGQVLIKVQLKFIKMPISVVEVGERCRNKEGSTTTMLCSTLELRKHYE